MASEANKAAAAAAEAVEKAEAAAGETVEKAEAAAGETVEKAAAATEHSTTELVASAKMVAEAAQSALKNEGDKVDKGKVAEAAGDLLDAAAKYGKLDEQKGIGQYVEKAADYLHQFQGNAGDGSEPEESKKEESGGGLGGLASLAGGFFKK
ncbi:hypothetical protein VNO78_11947 [Psophocarpus tetragonolobus]|uniref:Uncharacterized protein n=1 Tax=Psophocarpus tetragonolobus TaxID=3891 RepID=A0AAN9SQ44_PSOTE